MGEQCVQGGRRNAANTLQCQLAGIGRVLQVGVHRQTGQHRIIQLPRTRLLAQQQVGPWAHLQCSKAGVDAIAVGLQHCAFVAQGGIKVGMRACAQTMHAHFPVQRYRCGAKQFGQFAGGGAAHEVHFEITFLRMHVAQRTGHIALVGRIHRHRAVGVARNADRCTQALQRQFAL